MADSWVLFLLAFSCCVYGDENYECTTWIVKEDITSSEAAGKDKVDCSFHKENNTINVDSPISCLNSSALAELPQAKRFHDDVELSFLSNNTLYTTKLQKKKDNIEKRKRRECWCNFCKSKAVKCRTCSPVSEPVIWDKITFTLISTTIVVGIFLFLFATFRRKITKTWKPNDTECARKTSSDIPGEVALGRLLYTDGLDSNSGTYSFPRAEIEVGRCYRPLRQSMTNTSATHFQLQPFIHGPFEDENEDETYTKIIDDEIDCDSGHPTHQDTLSHHVCDVTSSFLKTECQQGVYNRLSHQSKTDKPTDCMPDTEENYHHFCCPTQPPEARLSDGYELAKTVTDAHVCFNKVKETPAHDNSSNNHISQGNNASNTPLDHTSDEHTPHDDSLENNTPHHQTFHDSEEASHNNPSYESESRENYSPRHILDDDTTHHEVAPDPTPLDNLADDKHRGEASRISPCLHHENISTVITADNSDNIHEPLQEAAQAHPV